MTQSAPVPPNPLLGYGFSDPALRRRALTHRSARGEHNERLEFLGDAVLGLLVAEWLITRYPRADEGRLSRLRAAVVRRESLAGVARVLDLGSHLTLGPGERKSGGAHRESILADALEALIGAVYLDGGLPAARNAVRELFEPTLESAAARSHLKDPKTQLQEYLQGRGLTVPDYETLAGDEIDDAGEPAFQVSCSVPALCLTAVAGGRTRRQAEQAAALKLLERLDGGG